MKKEGTRGGKEERKGEGGRKKGRKEKRREGTIGERREKSKGDV